MYKFIRAGGSVRG